MSSAPIVGRASSGEDSHLGLLRRGPIYSPSVRPQPIKKAQPTRNEDGINEEHLDLTVDFDSDVEDSLGTDLWAGRHDREYLEDCIETLGYEDNPSEFWDYYEKSRKEWTTEQIQSMLSYLKSNGVQRWFKNYVIHRKLPVQKLFFVFGVLLTREQRMLDDKALLPLLKAAAFRSMRRRAERSVVVWPTSNAHIVDFMADRIQNSKNIIVLSGAGISVSCGIPDFRSRNGLYAQLFSSGAYDLDDPQQMFDINYFKQNPYVFYSFAHKIYPSNFTPSRCHYFIRAIEKQGKLLRNYTQNIDCLEAKAGIKRAVQCHGSFATATCVNCGLKIPGDAIKEDLLAQRVPLCKKCNPESIDLRPKKMRRKKKKKKRNDGWESDEPEEVAPPLPPGVMKPDITFFGEKLSKAFDKQVFEDIKTVDLLIVMGTSLRVRPVSEIISHLPHHVHRMVINKTPLPQFVPDYQLLGDADVVVKHLACKLRWSLEPPEAVNGNGSALNGQVPPTGRPRSARVKENNGRDYGRRKRNVTVVGTSGVLLFKGAEGGKYVDDLIAERKAQKSNADDGEAVEDVNLTDSSESDDGESVSDASDNEGRVSKRPRRSLT